MKIKINTLEPKFEPIELAITIESKEELDFLELFSNCDVSIPNLFINNEKNLVRVFLESLRAALWLH